MGGEGLNDTVDRLKALEGGLLGEGGKPPEAPGGETPGAVPGEAEAMADQALAFGKQYLADNGFSPINQFQEMILRIGLIGCIRKYNISMNFAFLEKYPEAALAVGGAWIVVDKVKEAKTKQAAQEEPKEAAPGPVQ